MTLGLRSPSARVVEGGEDAVLSKLTTMEIKAFVPARDFDLSKRFYSDLGFTVAWSSDDLAYLHAGPTSFLLQRFYRKEHADNFMMHLLVEDVEAWWQHVEMKELARTYAVRVNPPENRPWGMRDFTIDDPTGVLWRIGQTISSRPPAGRDEGSPASRDPPSGGTLET